MRQTSRFITVVLLALSVLCATVHAATLKATYTFGNTLNAQQGGVPALVPTDPLMLNSFTTDSVFGATRSVYAFNGNASPPTQQAGLTFNDISNVISPTSYSLEVVFQFSGGTNAWRRIIDVQNRQSDSGFYVDPANHLDLFPSGSGTSTFSTGTYADVILTNDGSTVRAYLNGNPEFAIADTQMNINNANNPNQLVHLFLDNVVAGGQGEFSSGRIGLLEAFDGVLTPAEAASLAANPYGNTGGPAAIPEPSSILLFFAGIGFFAFRKRESDR